MRNTVIFAGIGILSGGFILLSLWLGVLPKWVLYIWIVSIMIGLIGVFQENT